VGDTADHTLDREMLRNAAARVHRLQPAPVEGPAMLVEVPPRQTVLQRNHWRGWTPQGRQAWGDIGDLVCLQGQEHKRLLAELGHRAGVGRAHASHPLRAAVLVDQRQTLAADRFEMGAARQHRNLMPDQRQLAREETADGTSADDANLHCA
jgi:hypothetical protein